MKTPLLIFLAVSLSLASVYLLSKPRLPAKAALPQIERYIRQLNLRNVPPGLTAAVVKDGRTVYTEAFGYADTPENIQTTTDTAYHWWSMTKVPTAIAVLQLSEQGRLEMDAPVSQILPYFDVTLNGVPTEVTIRQLLRHTSGLPDPTPAMIGWVHYEDELYDQTDLLRKYLPDYNELEFAPDTKASYSNLGYMVLGAVIEAVSEQNFEFYIRENILEPLAVKSTDFLYSEKLKSDAAAGSHPLVSFYTPLLPSLLDMQSFVCERSGWVYWMNPVYVDVTPPSGLIGSVVDASRLALSLLERGTLLTNASHDLLLPHGESPTDRPLGWAQFGQGERMWVQHRGGGPGFATIMRLYPDENLGIVIMGNSTNMPAEKLVEAFAALEW